MNNHSGRDTELKTICETPGLKLTLSARQRTTRNIWAAGRGPILMNILVTGASGFVGTALTHGLVARGHSVRAVVRGASAPAADSPGLHRAAVRDIAGEIDRRVLLEGIDVVVHLAAVAHRAADAPRSAASMSRERTRLATPLRIGASIRVPQFRQGPRRGLGNASLLVLKRSAPRAAATPSL